MQATAEDYYTALMALRPPGPAWPSEDDHLRAIADELGRVHARTLDLVEEADPRTTAELLSAWEGQAGLPRDCGDLAETTAERRTDLVAALIATGGQSRPYFLQIAAAHGYPGATIAEFSPFRAGRSRCGAAAWRTGSQLQRFVWRMHVGAAPYSYFRVGRNRCGRDPQLVFKRAEKLECTVRRLAPGHTQVVFLYTRGPELL